MILDGKNDREIRGDECMVSDCRDYFYKLDFGRQSMSVIDQWHSFRSIPTVNCYVMSESSTELGVNNYNQLQGIVSLVRRLGM
jgi:hypothetical protein